MNERTAGQDAPLHPHGQQNAQHAGAQSQVDVLREELPGQAAPARPHHRAHSHLASEDVDSVRAAGEAMSLEELVDLALQELKST